MLGTWRYRLRELRIERAGCIFLHVLLPDETPRGTDRGQQVAVFCRHRFRGTQGPAGEQIVANLAELMAGGINQIGEMAAPPCTVK